MPTLFSNVEGIEEYTLISTRRSSKKSYRNKMECTRVVRYIINMSSILTVLNVIYFKFTYARLLHEMYRIKQEDITVMTLYRHQVNLMQEIFEGKGLISVQIKTINDLIGTILYQNIFSFEILFYLFTKDKSLIM